ncbi:MAG: TIGR02265 family protein [Desulfobacteraceae bacterium]|nr:MAG: TIGR02265 family protein [Desulfobacteraceae bacterium]
MEEKKVKGSMLLEFVRMIRAHKNLDWNKFLQPEDWDIINSLVLPAKWYPLDFYRRCSMAAFVLLAKNNLEGARANGQVMAKHLFESTYKSMIQNKEPMRGLNQFVLTYASFYNFSMLKLEKAGPKHAKVHHNHDGRDKSNVPYCHQLQGMFETLVQMNGGTNLKVVLSAKQWEGAPETIFDITWE